MKFGMYKSIIILFLSIEISLRGLLGFVSLGEPIANKIRYGADIVVPHFEDGVIIDSSLPESGEQKGIFLYAKKGLILFWQGFTLNTSNAGFRKLKSYRQAGKVFQQNPYIPYVRKPDIETSIENYVAKSNEDGYYVFPAAGEEKLRIFMAGGSTTDSPFPYFTWKYMNAAFSDGSVSVINGGLASWTTADNIASFAFRGLSYEPHYLVVYQAYIDMFPSCSRNFKNDYSHWRKSYDSGLLDKHRFFDRLPTLLDNLALYSLVRKVLLKDLIRKFDMGIWGATAHYSPSYASDPFNGKDVFKRNIISLIGLAREHKVEVVLLTQAHQKKFGLQSTYDYAEEMNDILREVATSRPYVHFYDFAKDIGPQIDALMRRDQVHFDLDGYEVLGKYVADKIIKLEKDRKDAF